MELSSLQNSIFSLLSSKASLSDDSVVKTYEVEDAINDEYGVVFSEILERKPTVYGLCSLPDISTKVFVGFTDDDPEKLGEILAHLSAQSEVNDAMDEGYLARIEQSDYRDAGWYGTILLSLTELLSDFDNKASFEDEEFDFHLVIPLNKEEYKLTQENGVQALKAQWQQQPRALFSFQFDAPATSLLNPDDIVLNQVHFEEKVEEVPELPDFESIETAPTQQPAQPTPAAPIEPVTEKLKRWMSIQGKKQVIGETILGTIMLVGGLIGLFGFVYNEQIIASLIPSVFALAGGITLVGAFRESQALTRKR